MIQLLNRKLHDEQETSPIKSTFHLTIWLAKQFLFCKNKTCKGEYYKQFSLYNFTYKLGTKRATNAAFYTNDVGIVINLHPFKQGAFKILYPLCTKIEILLNTEQPTYFYPLWILKPVINSTPTAIW